MFEVFKSTSDTKVTLGFRAFEDEVLNPKGLSLLGFEDSTNYKELDGQSKILLRFLLNQSNRTFSLIVKGRTIGKTYRPASTEICITSVKFSTDLFCCLCSAKSLINQLEDISEINIDWVKGSTKRDLRGRAEGRLISGIAGFGCITR